MKIKTGSLLYFLNLENICFLTVGSIVTGLRRSTVSRGKIRLLHCVVTLVALYAVKCFLESK